MSAYPTEPCRSCTRPVIWALTKNGHPMPVDAAPVADGNIDLERRTGRPPLAMVIRGRHAEDRDDLRKSHFATCPQAAQWRTGRRPA